MALITCPECGKKISDSAERCIICGFPIHKKLYVEKKKCAYCGSMNNALANECFSCGATEFEYKQEQENRKTNVDTKYQNNNLVDEDDTTIESPNVETKTTYVEIDKGTPKNKWVALILCLFLGVFGVHKFYEGKIAMGILYLFTMGIFGFGWLADLLVLIFKTNPYYVESTKKQGQGIVESQQKKNRKEIISLVLGILTVMFLISGNPLFLITSVVGIVLSIKALSKTLSKTAKEFATVGLICSAAPLILVLWILAMSIYGTLEENSVDSTESVYLTETEMIE